jgi:hypothetical protein
MAYIAKQPFVIPSPKMCSPPLTPPSRLDAGQPQQLANPPNGHARAPDGSTQIKNDNIIFDHTTEAIEIKPVKPKRVKIAAGVLRAEFEQWWAIFPKRPFLTMRNREKAFKEFQKIRAEGVSFDWLVTQARNYDIHESGNDNPDPMYILLPSNWLRNRRFEDEFPQTRKGS